MTFFPKTADEISKVIKFAKRKGKRIRAAGMKHSWTELFSDNEEYLMYLLPLEVTDHLSFARIGLQGVEAELEKWASELTGIELDDSFGEAGILDDEGAHAAVKVGE